MSAHARQAPVDTLTLYLLPVFWMAMASVSHPSINSYGTLRSWILDLDTVIHVRTTYREFPLFTATPQLQDAYPGTHAEKRAWT